MSVKKTKDFRLTSEMVEMINKFSPAQEEIIISKVCTMINTLVEDEEMRKLKASTLTGWLESVGVLKSVINSDGVRSRVPTAIGREIGIKTEDAENDRGAYTRVTYTREAQEFIFDNIFDFKEYLDNAV